VRTVTHHCLLALGQHEPTPPPPTPTPRPPIHTRTRTHPPTPPFPDQVSDSVRADKMGALQNHIWTAEEIADRLAHLHAHVPKVS
jgi:hypothetical protein